MIARLLARPGLTLALVALLTLGLGAAAVHVEFDNTPETWLPSGVAGLEDLERFRERFGEDSMIVVFTPEARIDDPGWRRDFAALAADLGALPGVERVEAPRRAVAAEGSAARGTAEVPADDASASPLEPHLLSADGGHAALALFLARGLAPRDRAAMVAGVEAALGDAMPRVGVLRLAGPDVITRDLDTGTARSLAALSPLVLLTMCGIFYAATRSARAVGAVLLAAIAAGVWTIGVMALAGRSLNLVIVVMPAILAVMTAAYAMHVLSRFLGNVAPDGDPADRGQRARWWEEACRATWRPCLLSAVTTAAGFASLATSEIPPIRDLGAFTALGVGFALLLTFSLIPVLLSSSRRVRPRPVAERRWTEARALAATDLIRRHATAILVLATLATAVGAIGLGRLEVESHILRFFPAEHRVPRSYAEIEEKLMGLTPFELVLEGSLDRVAHADTLAALDRYLDQALQGEPLLLQVLSPLAGDAARSLPATARAARLRELAAEAGADADAARRFVWRHGDRLALRTTLAARTGSSDECHALVERLRAKLSDAFPPGVDAVITGGPTLLIRGQVLLLDTQVRSFALALLVVTLAIAIAFRSLGILAVSLLPNLMPIAVTLGLMGLLDIPLNTATVTVAGIAIGLIVDDTIHILHRYAAARRGGSDPAAAVADTLHTVGRPVLVTSLAVAAGFGGFALSGFPPTRYFGLLMAWASLTAVACDLLVLPALLLWRAGRTASGARLAAGRPA